MPTFDFEGGAISSDFLQEDSGGNPWSIQTSDVNGGTYGIKAESGNNSESSNLFLIADFDAGDVTFYEKVSSESTFDFGRFFTENIDTDGTNAHVNVSGNAGSFTQRTHTITAGVHSLHWAYAKDSADPANDDTWYLDDIVVPAYTLVDLSNAETFAAVPTGTEWTDDATYPWRTYTRKMFNSTGSVRSGSITHSQQTDLEYNSDSGAGAGEAISIFRADSESSSFDYIEYRVDGARTYWIGGYDGASAGTPICYIESVASGTHEYIWRYKKDSSDTPPTARDQGEVFLFYEPGMGTEAAIGLAWQENAWMNAAWVSGAWANTTTVSGSTGATEGADTSSASGGVTVSGSLAETEGADTSSAAAEINASGSLAETEGADVSAASGSPSYSASSAVTEGADASAAAGGVEISGSLAETETADASTASGAIAGAAIEGTLAETEGADTSAVSGDVNVIGSVAVTEDVDVIAASGILTIAGAVGVTEGADVSAVAAALIVSGTAALAEVADDLAAAGFLPSIGTVAVTGDDDYLAGSGVAGDLENTGAFMVWMRRRYRR